MLVAEAELMRVLHILGGRLNEGAARGTLYLHNALRNLGVDSRLICPDPNAAGEGIISLAGPGLPSLMAKFRSKVESLPSRLYPGRRRGIFSPGISGVDWSTQDAYRAADIVHLHWVNRGMLSISGLARLDKPCVWTLRDMWPFTGGCHYSLDCRKYQVMCGACPALGSRHEHDLSRWVFQRKKKYYSRHIGIVGISSWVSDCARSSELLRGNDVRTILNCVDTDQFRPMDKIKARELLSLPKDRSIMLHGALCLDDHYKGGHLLEEAKKFLSNEDFYMCSFGRNDGKREVRRDRTFGYIEDDDLLRALYCAADVLVFPSVQEAFGKVAAESLACGTPVVVFDATGPKDIVQHKRTGYTAVPFDPVDLANGVRWLLEDRQRLVQIGINAAHDALDRFSPAAAAKQYCELYEEKLGAS